MTHTLYGWTVVKPDSQVMRNAANGVLAIFPEDDKKSAAKVAGTKAGSRVIPCTITYEV